MQLAPHYLIATASPSVCYSGQPRPDEFCRCDVCETDRFLEINTQIAECSHYRLSCSLPTCGKSIAQKVSD